MTIVAQGIDLVECERIQGIWQRYGDRFLDRLLTPAETRYVHQYKNAVPSVAGRFAAKEAILKVLGTGWRGKIAWRDMEILNDRAGQPQVTLTGECGRVAAGLGIVRILVSITHTEHYAAATAIGIREKEGCDGS
ncbi:MAG: holo-ACP synthase [Phycisphaerae bacterium]|nr:holo-ACP synthase [Phycisphaerae bacterium]